MARSSPGGPTSRSATCASTSRFPAPRRSRSSSCSRRSCRPLATRPSSALAPGTVDGDPTLGDLRLDLLADTGVTVANLLAILSLAQPDVLLGDLRIDRMAVPPTLTLADFIRRSRRDRDAVTARRPAPRPRHGHRRPRARGARSRSCWCPTTFDAYLLGALDTYTEVSGHDITLGELGTWRPARASASRSRSASSPSTSTTRCRSPTSCSASCPASEFPFENFPISSLDLSDGREVFRDSARPGRRRQPRSAKTWPTNEDNIQVLSGADPTDPVKVHILLPPGSTFQFLGGGDLQGALTDQQLATDPDGRERATVTFPALPANHTGGIHLDWTPGILLGYPEMTFAITTLDGTPSASRRTASRRRRTAPSPTPPATAGSTRAGCRACRRTRGATRTSTRSRPGSSAPTATSTGPSSPTSPRAAASRPT